MFTLPVHTEPHNTAPLPSFKTGLGSYMYRWNVELRGLSPADLLGRAAQAGAQVVQLCDNIPLDALSPAGLKSLAAQAKTLGLELELGIKGSRPEQICSALAAAEMLGAHLLRVVLADRGWSPCAAEAVEIARGLLPALRDKGIALAIENHFDLHPNELAEVVEAVGDPLVGICLDPFNAVYQLACQQDTVRRLAPHTLSVHIKDVNIRRWQTGFYIYGCRLGEGLLDLPGLLRELHAAGRAPALLLEAWMDRLDDDAATCAQEEDWACLGLKYLNHVTSG